MRAGILVLASLLAAPIPANARLVSQSLQGVQRICAYPNPSLSQRRATPLVFHRIGSGEPCPIRYPGPAPERQRQTIPPMATLVRQRTANGLVVCDYGYLGRVYSRVRSAEQSCPYTPHFPD